MQELPRSTLMGHLREHGLTQPITPISAWGGVTARTLREARSMDGWTTAA